ncbi:MAG: ATP-binding protein [Caldilineaceae bacterium]
MNNTIAQHLQRIYHISYLITNAELNVTETQGRAELFIECAPSSIGRPLADVVPELIGIEAELEAILSGKKEFICFETVNRDRSDGQVTYVRMTELAKRNDDGVIDGIIHMLEDVSEYERSRQEITQQHNEAQLLQRELRASNLELQALNAELAQINELHSLLVSMATHEIRGALTMVQAYLGLLEGELTLPTSQSQTYLERVQQGMDRLRKLISTLLDMVLIELGQLEILLIPVDLAPLVKETIDLLQPQIAAKSHTITLQIHNDIPLALCDQIRIGQIIDNLLSNAIKYTPEGGQIQVTLEASDNGEHILLAISDTGIGIAPQNIETLFTRFYRTKEARLQGQGFGLGLYIVHVLIELHGGAIWVESQPNVGSTFTVQLPVAKTDVDLHSSTFFLR